MAIPHQLIEEVGLLLDAKGIKAARSTCRLWRNHLSQRVSRQPSGHELLACPDLHTWQQRVTSLGAVFPALKQLLVYAGGRVSGQVFDEEMSVLATAFPSLQHLEMRYLLLPQASAPSAAPPYTPLPAVPRGIEQFTRLTELCLVMCGSLLPAHVPYLPTSLKKLRLATGQDDSSGLTDAVLEELGPRLTHLVHLEGDTAPYTITARGLKALPRGLQSLLLFGVQALSKEEVLALCSNTPGLHHLAMEIPSDQHEAAALLAQQHPCLAQLDLALNEDEADHDPTYGELLHSLRAMRADAAVSEPHTTGALPTINFFSSSMQPSSPSLLGNPSSLSPMSPSTSRAVPSSNSCSSTNHVDSSRCLTGAVMPGYRGITALMLQSINLPVPAAGSEAPGLMEQLTECLPSLTDLSIAEPWVQGGQGRALQGSLTALSRLTGLRTFLVSLMPGFPIPALHVMPEAVQSLASCCTALVSLTALNALDPACLPTLHNLHLDTLAISPAATCSNVGLQPPTVDLATLPASLTSLSISNFHITLSGSQNGDAEVNRHQAELGRNSLKQQPDHSTAVQDEGAPSAVDGVAVNYPSGSFGSCLEDLVITQSELGEGLQPPALLLQPCTALQSLLLRNVSGLRDDMFQGVSTLSHLTSLQVLPAPSPDPPLTQHAIVHCSSLQQLLRLEWEGWGAGSQQPCEPELIQQLAAGARSLHVLRLCQATDKAVRADTQRMVMQQLPLCSVAPC